MMWVIISEENTYSFSAYPRWAQTMLPHALSKVSLSLSLSLSHSPSLFLFLSFSLSLPLSLILPLSSSLSSSLFLSLFPSSSFSIRLPFLTLFSLSYLSSAIQPTTEPSTPCHHTSICSLCEYLLSKLYFHYTFSYTLRFITSFLC